jgi:hypothetical protein
MLRKLALALVAAGSLGIAAMAPTGASAEPYRPHFRGHAEHHGFGMHRGWRHARAHMHHHGCIQQRLVPTPWGPRYRPVNVCRY